jgi:hypothetical protein
MPKKKFVTPQRLTTNAPKHLFPKLQKNQQASPPKSSSTSHRLPALPALLLLLQLVDLLYPPLVPATLELGLHPDLDDPLDAPRAEHVAR